jgi:hypothetical protein
MSGHAVSADVLQLHFGHVLGSTNTLRAACMAVSCLVLPCLQKFDAGRCSPLLTHLLSSGQLQVQGKKAFVPGCG